MVGLWVQVLVVVLSGACGAAAAVFAARRQAERASAVPVRESEPRRPVIAPPSPLLVRDRWFGEWHRCEQAVCRAARAVESVSSVRARQGLSGVVHRMDAELPNVRVLVELGRGLEGDGIREADAACRVLDQLVDASARFAAVTDHVLECVVELVAEPDLERVSERVTVLRDRFPLVRPMSAVVGADRSERSPVDISV